jgi:hypothetical protein
MPDRLAERNGNGIADLLILCGDRAGEAPVIWKSLQPLALSY